MPSYVIASRDSEELETPVFYVDETGEAEAIVLFTRADLARQYIESARWDETHVVAELTPLNLLRWVLEAHEAGTEYLSVDPDRAAQLRGEEQPVLLIEEQLEDLAASLEREIDTLAVETHGHE